MQLKCRLAYLVELHGGTIQAESPGKGQGATFTVRLPLHKNPENQVLISKSNVAELDNQDTLLAGVQLVIRQKDHFHCFFRSRERFGFNTPPS
ncbi:hypothetical protein [Nostoc sp. NIES-3756]|uniref:hypothetical protein n=1 Tax=Nostoc sp. NIES-3756 TaxID=1751286 RepID=UPI000A7C97E0